MSELSAFTVSKLPEHEVSVAPVWTPMRDDLSPDQLDVFNKVMAWHNDPNARQHLKLGGYAGTGKTTLVSCLAHELEGAGESIVYCAFTGKAVNVLSRKLRAAGIDGQCMTLHSLLYKPNVNNKGEITGWVKVDALPASLIVVDEASMVGKELWDDLVSFGIPILAVGDHGQLPPVGDAVVNLMTDPDLRLEHIHRQAEGNPILALAQWVRDGKPLYKFQPHDERVSFIPAYAAVSSSVATDPNNFVAICYTNRMRTALNNFTRQALRANNGGLGPAHSDGMPLVGDTVVCLKNRKPIFNGMRGKLVMLDGDPDRWSNVGAMVDFVDDGLRMTGKILAKQFNAPKTFDKLEAVTDRDGHHPYGWAQLGMLFDFGYALTCHKAQGSQFRDVVIIYENLFRDDDTRKRWLYTAATRASENLYIVRS